MRHKVNISDTEYIFKLQPGDLFNFISVNGGGYHRGERKWKFLRREGKNCYYEDVKSSKEHFTNFKRKIISV